MMVVVPGGYYSTPVAVYGYRSRVGKPIIIVFNWRMYMKRMLARHGVSPSLEEMPTRGEASRWSLRLCLYI